MERKLLHTPEGVRDLYGTECENKLLLQNRMHQVLKLYGYRDIQMPSFEFFDIFNKERGSVASKNMFKFFDREGNTLVLRPDMTPQIARCAAKYFENEELPIKLCYLGNTFVNKSSYQGRLKETTQLGCELIGDSSVTADAEMLEMMIEALLAAGLKEFQVEVGQVAYFKGLVNEAGIDSDTEEELRLLIQKKNFFGVEELARGCGLSDSVREALFMLPQLFGSAEKLDDAKKYVNNAESLGAIEHLKSVYELLKVYGYEKYISFDLGMLSELTYYTGIIFRAVTYEVGEPVANGGRYDELICQYGKPAASIGFSINVDFVLLALNRQKIDLPSEKLPLMILYRADDAADAIRLADHYRKSGISVGLFPFAEGRTKQDYEKLALSEGYGAVIVADRASVSPNCKV